MRRVASRIFCSVDESDDIAIIEITKAVNLVGNRNRVAEAIHDLSCQFKTEVVAFCSNVKEDVTRSGDGVAGACANLAKRMKLGGSRCTKKFVPGLRPESNDTCKARLHVTKLNGAYEPREVRAE